MLAVASQYDIHSLRQTVLTFKFAVWKSFYRMRLFCSIVCTALLCVCFMCFKFDITSLKTNDKRKCYTDVKNIVNQTL